jgi:hypothetical protein
MDPTGCVVRVRPQGVSVPTCWPATAGSGAAVSTCNHMRTANRLMLVGTNWSVRLVSWACITPLQHSTSYG